jgi:HTH-like domain
LGSGEGHQEQWIELRMRIREIGQTRLHYGYRMIRVLLNREGWKVGKDLVYRLYKEEGLGLRNQALQFCRTLTLQPVQKYRVHHLQIDASEYPSKNDILHTFV